MSLFQQQNIILHSGQLSDFKIECDDLTYRDIETLAYLISKRLKFFSVFGVPNGGLKIAKVLEPYRSTDSHFPVLVVDDVLTTGNSMNQFVIDHHIKNPIGVVLFSRGKCPDWITPIFQMW